MNIKRPGTIAVIVNNAGGRIFPSETFLTAHINQMPAPVVPLVGIPGHRILIHEDGKTIPDRSAIPLGLRWLARRAGFSTVASQDRKAFARFLNQRNICAVVAEYGPTAVSVMDACRDASVPLIAHFHGFDAYTGDVLENYKEKYLKLFEQAAAVIAVSRHMKAQLLSLGASDERTYVNACGADIPKGAQAHPQSSDIRFLMVGRLVEKKAPFLSLIAFAKLAETFPNARLDVVGDGVLLNACRQIATALGVAHQVTFHGAQPHAKVFELMRVSRCFIQHSVRTENNDHEGTPVGLLEAMGMGLPAVSTRHGGISDVIRDGVTGSLIDEYDVDGMSNAMLAYAEDAALAQRCGDAARLEVSEQWTTQLSINRLYDIITASMSGGRCAEPAG